MMSDVDRRRKLIRRKLIMALSALMREHGPDEFFPSLAACIADEYGEDAEIMAERLSATVAYARSEAALFSETLQ